MNEHDWNQRFDVPLAVFLEMCVDQNLKIFLGMHMRSDVDDRIVSGGSSSAKKERSNQSVENA